MASIKDRLEQLKTERGLTNRQLTELVNQTEPKEITVSESLISDILTVTNNKSGKDKRDKPRSVDYQKILKLARVLDVNTEYLCGWSDVRRGANDDVFIAARTTGLKETTINELRLLRDASNPDVITDAIGDLVDDAVLSTNRKSWDGVPASLKGFDWESPDNSFEAEGRCFLSDFYNLRHAEILCKKTNLTHGTVDLHSDKGEMVTVQRDFWINYYANRLTRFINKISSEREAEIFTSIRKISKEKIEFCEKISKAIESKMPSSKENASDKKQTRKKGGAK